jgi:chaperonin cofactor prefoldin
MRRDLDEKQHSLQLEMAKLQDHNQLLQSNLDTLEYTLNAKAKDLDDIHSLNK